LAAEGHGGIVFLTGEPGVGKTRLAREALARVRGHGFTVLNGRALPLETGLAYAPILDAFGPLLGSLAPDRLEILVGDLPHLGRLFDGLGLPLPVLPMEGLGDPLLERTRLFAAVSRLLGRLAQESPVVLFVDDVHRADPATLDLLHYLARGISDQRALLLATYSGDNSHLSHGLRLLIGSLDRDGSYEEIVVPRLDAAAVDDMARGILDGEAPRELLALLNDRAGGTPLYVEALIAALVESGNLSRSPTGNNNWVFDAQAASALPPTVRRLILRRLETLDWADRRVLDLIAIMGDATSHAVLQAASGLEEGVLLDALRRLRGAGLVTEGMDGLDVAYGITHPLIQEVAYTDLPEAARRRAHMAAIKALESFSEGRPHDLNRLAGHYRGAGSEVNTDRGLEALVGAGERALALYANDVAARYLEAALTMTREYRQRPASGAGERGTPVPSPDIMPRLLERLGEAWERLGKRGAAIEVWNEALAERERTGPAVGNAADVSRLRRQLAVAEWDRGNFDVANSHLSAGLLLHGKDEPCQEVADLNFARFHILYRTGDLAGMEETTAELLSLAERLASPRVEGEANMAASRLSLWQNDIPKARERALHALMVAESLSEGRDLAICCRAHNALSAIAMRMGDHHLIRYHVERGLAVARRLGAPTEEVFLLVRLAYANFMSGAWEDSLRCTEEAISLARLVGNSHDLTYSLAGRAMILAFRGDLPEAEACVSEARKAFANVTTADRGFFSLVDIAETALALERGQAERALGVAKGFVTFSASAATPIGPTPHYRAIALVLLAEAQVVAGEAAGALQTARDIIGLGPAGTPYLSALANRAEGLAWQASGQWEAAVACQSRANETFTELGMPFEAARSVLEQAVSALQARPELAARASQQSLAMFERLGARRYADHARRLLHGLGISPLATRRPRLGGVRVSVRELEIAQLVAQGLTTVQVAERLTLSPRTVNAHLRNIYGRLGIGSRTALARIVIEAGLL
ncbi:MAG: AAA family ATPase, partial [Dehalococcoidia bacterium]|nr:AAA family ATPase [Dehalococcoidia bacterium]